ncbi:ABC transporter ATP-binding protein/permease [Flavobacteriaceae bacterium]|nr:ABC transporter ATP-binding protein/permease [Flavobacteriaceae bacterium]MDA9571938.1 ABC transporter ATP-binding protein/permease [Flavobacteriaceae bacterium]MDC3354302.1 ABC transporter ATP-binding protein/permease [Flavobacteriaceae bacterium]
MKSSFQNILQFGLKYKSYALLNIIFNAFYALFSALSFVSLIPMLNVLFETTEDQIEPATYEGIFSLPNYIKDSLNFYIAQRVNVSPEETLILVVGLVLSLFFLKNISNYLALYFITYLRNGIIKDLRNAIYVKIIALPISYFSEKKKGDLMAKITSDVTELQISFLSILELIVREPLTILFSLIAMLFFSVKLTLFVLFFIPLSGLIISRIGKKLKSQSEKIQQEQGDFLSLIDETINGQKIIKTFGAGSHFKEKFKSATTRFYDFSNQLLHRASLAGPTSEFLGIIVIGILLWFGGRMVLVEGSISGTSFIVYMGLAYNILTPAKAISKASYSIQKGNAAAERILEILNTKDQLKDAANAQDLKTFSDKIIFNKVAFRYEETPVLEEVSFEVTKGQMVALVGPSGGGKTTLTYLLNRFYDIDEGSLTLDGIPINQIKKESLYKKIGMVTQESILFNDSVKNNLKLGNPKASEEAIRSAAIAANADEFIQRLPEGYNTRIGDSGNKLSGGQKQRLTIARALLKDPELLILDEATSALDTEAEQQVQLALEELMKNRTSFVIAHRLSTIQKADLILVLKQGKIVASGTHKNLLKTSAEYNSWVEIQRMD